MNACGRLTLRESAALIARAAVLVMTFTSSALAGLFALRDGGFRFLPWLVMTIALMLGIHPQGLPDAPFDLLTALGRL